MQTRLKPKLLLATKTKGIRAKAKPIPSSKTTARRAHKHRQAVPVGLDSKIKLGKPVAVSKHTSCVKCKLYLRCHDPKRSVNYACSRYESLLSSFDFSKLRINSAERAVEAGQDHDALPEEVMGRRKVVRLRKAQDDDFTAIVDGIINEERHSPVARDLKVDDRDMPLAKNFFEWATSKQFLNLDMTPFAKQLEIGVNLFSEYCPDCSNVEYVKNVPTRHKPRRFLENVQLLEWGVCPKCKGTKSGFYADGKLDVPCELAGLGGQRGTKSTTTAMILSYHTHGYIKLQNPTKVFKLLGSTLLHTQLTALTWQGAKDLLWDPTYNMILDSPWYQQYHLMLDDYGQKYGEELYKLKDTFYLNRARKLFIYPIGPDRKKMRGRTSYGGAIDEIGLMDSEDGSNKVKMNADEVYTSIKNSLRTVRSAYYRLLKRGNNSVLPPILCCISSPLSKRDMIVRLREKALHNTKMHSFHYATWEMNPDITKADLLEEFDDDTARVMRDFGAVPPNSSLPYIEDVEMVRPVVNKNLANRYSLFPTVRRSGDVSTGHTYRTGKLVSVVPHDFNNRALALDAGYNSNSFALASGYYDTKLHRPVIDILLELTPTQQYPINFSFIYTDVISQIIKDANVKLLVSDRWQNNKILHDAEEEHKVLIETYSVHYDDFITFKEEMLVGSFSIPMPELSPEKVERVGDKEYPEGFHNKPLSHFIYQLISVQDQGKDVTKGDEVTDDLLRAAVLLYSYLIDPEYRELCSGTSDNVNRRAGVPGFVGLLSQGASGAGNVNGNFGLNGALGLLGANRR